MPKVLVNLGELRGLIYSSDKEQCGRPRTFIHFMETPPRWRATRKESSSTSLVETTGHVPDEDNLKRRIAENRGLVDETRKPV